MLRFFLLSIFLLCASLSAEVELDPKKSLELNEKGVAAVSEKDFDDAEDYFFDAIDADPRNLTAVFNLAGMYLTNEDNEKALKLLKSYTERYPKDAGLSARLADTYFSLQKVDEAEKNYLKTLKLSEKYPGINAKLGTVYSLKQELKKAEKHYELAAVEDPSKYDVLANLSALKLGNKNTEDAIRFAKKALQVKATSEVYITLGTAYEMSNNLKSSLIAFQRAQDLGDARPELAEKIKNIQSKVEG